MFYLFTDPSEWNSNHINSWLLWCTKAFSLNNDTKKLINDLSIDNLNGKELLTKKLIDWNKINNGKILARHLGYLHFQATGLKTEALIEDEKSNGES